MIWLLVRLVATWLTAAVDQTTGPGTFAPLLVTSALCAVDFYRRREGLLVANLGIAPAVAVTASILPALIGEMAILGAHAA